MSVADSGFFQRHAAQADSEWPCRFSVESQELRAEGKVVSGHQVGGQERPQVWKNWTLY